MFLVGIQIFHKIKWVLSFMEAGGRDNFKNSWVLASRKELKNSGWGQPSRQGSYVCVFVFFENTIKFEENSI